MNRVTPRSKKVNNRKKMAKKRQRLQAKRELVDSVKSIQFGKVFEITFWGVWMIALFRLVSIFLQMKGL